MQRQSFFQKNLNLLKFNYLHNKINTPLTEAIEENQKRRENSELKQAVCDFLKDDIPQHFTGTQPIFYLSRYIATPDYETLHYFNQVQKTNWPVVIGEDTADIFTSHHSLKRNLVKLPIVSGLAKNGEGILRYITTADFNSHQGKPLKRIKLHNQMTLTDFHKKLCAQFMPKNIQIVDESAWVDRHSRGELVKLYEKLLPLFLVHGVMLEQYEPDELDFLEAVVIPARKATIKRFGHTPLIAPLDVKSSKKVADINSYSSEVGVYINKIFQVQ
jgi:hypothetical protein